MLVVAGCFVGATFNFYVSTYHGRTPAMGLALLCLFLHYVGRFSSYLDPIFVLSTVIGDCGYYGLFPVCYFYLVEIVLFNKRVFERVPWFTYNSLVCLTLRVPRLLGQFLIDISIRHLSYDQVSVLMILLCLMAIILLAWLPESPCWLLHRHRVTEAEDVLNEMARVNGKKVTVKVTVLEDYSRGWTDWDGSYVNENLARVQFGDREEVFLERRSYPFFPSLLNVNLLPVSRHFAGSFPCNLSSSLQYTLAFLCIWMLIPMNDISKEGLDCNDQVVMGLAGILLTMTIEGILGRRNCLVIYSTLISMAAMFCDLLQRANVNVLTDIEKYENVNIIQHFIRFFADPVNSLVYLMTLSVYP